jgi:hypothetical protein
MQLLDRVDVFPSEFLWWVKSQPSETKDRMKSDPWAVFWVWRSNDGVETPTTPTNGNT